MSGNFSACFFPQCTQDQHVLHIYKHTNTYRCLHIDMRVCMCHVCALHRL